MASTDMASANMASEKAVQSDETANAENGDLDHAIDDLKGVLKKDAAGESGFDAPDADQPHNRRATDVDRTREAVSDFGADGATPMAAEKQHPGGMDLVMDIPIDVEVVLGTSRMPFSKLMDISEGSTIALDRKIGDPVEITVNGRVVGRGEITVMEGDETRFAVRLTEIVKTGRG